MSGLRRAKIRQAKRDDESREKAERLKLRVATLKLAMKKAAKAISKPQEILLEINYLAAMLEYEFEMMTESEKCSEAKRILEAVSDLVKAWGRVRSNISKRVDAMEEMGAEINGLTGTNERRLHLTERQKAAWKLSLQ